jgi:hypothetical protein
VKNNKLEICSICGCLLHREGEYAQPSLKGRSHATEHHYVPERFFGRSKNRRGTQREKIFQECPWGFERQKAVFCYECHEELLHNPVFLPEDIENFAELVRGHGLVEDSKTESRDSIAGRIRLFHEVIKAGIEELQKRA